MWFLGYYRIIAYNQGCWRIMENSSYAVLAVRMSRIDTNFCADTNPLSPTEAHQVQELIDDARFFGTPSNSAPPRQKKVSRLLWVSNKGRKARKRTKTYGKDQRYYNNLLSLLLLIAGIYTITFNRCWELHIPS